WAHNISADSFVTSRSLTIDNGGALYFLGTFYADSITIGNTTLYANGNFLPSRDFIAKYDAWGNIVWAVSLADSVHADGIAADSTGHLYVICDFTDTAFIGGMLITADSFGAFLARIDAGTGAVQWVRGFESKDGVYARDRSEERRVGKGCRSRWAEE